MHNLQCPTNDSSFCKHLLHLTHLRFDELQCRTVGDDSHQSVHWRRDITGLSRSVIRTKVDIAPPLQCSVFMDIIPYTISLFARKLYNRLE